MRCAGLSFEQYFMNIILKGYIVNIKISFYHANSKSGKLQLCCSPLQSIMPNQTNLKYFKYYILIKD